MRYAAANCVSVIAAVQRNERSSRAAADTVAAQGM
jgi:hypothetical protein